VGLLFGLGDVGGFASAAVEEHLFERLEIVGCECLVTTQPLQGDGNVTRTTDPADRRAVLVEATESSSALRPEIEAAWKTLEDRAVAGLDPAERAELQRLLEKVEINFSREDMTCP
jgi:hypothetical protein